MLSEVGGLRPDVRVTDHSHGRTIVLNGGRQVVYGDPERAHGRAKGRSIRVQILQGGVDLCHRGLRARQGAHRGRIHAELDRVLLIQCDGDAVIHRVSRTHLEGHGAGAARRTAQEVNTVEFRDIGDTRDLRDQVLKLRRSSLYL